VTEAAAVAAARTSGHRVEVTSLRGETKEVYALPSGAFELVQHLRPVRTRKEGQWVPVDTTLRRLPHRLTSGFPAAGRSRSCGCRGPVASCVLLAVHVLAPHQRDITLDEHRRPPHLPAFDDDDQAFRWLMAEHSALVAAVVAAFEHGRYDLAWQLSAAVHAGQHDAAIACLEDALGTYREKHHPGDEAETLETLGEALLATGQRVRAEECWQQALTLFGELGHPRADHLRVRLRQAS
jgi:hypothetical protein